MRVKRLDPLARGISHVLCPPAVAGLGILLAAAAQPSLKGWLCAITYILIAIIAPVVFLFRLLRQGHVSDLDVTQRQERPKPFIVALGGATVAWACLAALDAPPLLVRFAVAHTATIGLVLVITGYWKISVHSAGMAGVATLAVSLLGLQVLAVTPVVLVGWSRIYLKRHTTAQVLAGGLLGGLIFVLILPAG